jgi:hypothetical protein
LSELYKIILTASATLLGGVALLIVTQVLTRFIVDPLVDFRRLLGRVSYTLILHGNVLFNLSRMPPDKGTRSTDAVRDLASELNAFAAAVPLYKYLAILCLVPPAENVRKAARELIGLSNVTAAIPVPEIQRHYDHIAHLLSISIEGSSEK